MSRIKFYCQVSGHDVGTVILLAPPPILSFDITIKYYCEVRREDMWGPALVILLAPSPKLGAPMGNQPKCSLSGGAFTKTQMNI